VRAIIKEVHRWAPVGDFGIPHASTQSDEYNGQHIPIDTTVIPNLVALHRDSEKYQDPDKFAPERFLGHNQDAFSSAVNPDIGQRDHFHYGFGRRLCPGIHFAESSLFVVVSGLLWGFNIHSRPNEPLNMDDKISKPSKLCLICFPKQSSNERMLM
jgi:cytochrome P450